MARIFLFIGAILGGLAVILGAFASHGLKGSLPSGSLRVFEVGVRYQMYHALALLVVAAIAMHFDLIPLMLRLSGWFFVVGVLIFSGSLYALSLTNIGILGIITPIGGVLLILGWLTLAISAVSSQSKQVEIDK